MLGVKIVTFRWILITN